MRSLQFNIRFLVHEMNTLIVDNLGKKRFRCLLNIKLLLMNTNHLVICRILIIVIKDGPENWDPFFITECILGRFFNLQI